MNYGRIRNHDIANGIGVRCTLFVSGCRNHCPGCFQPETWDFDYGQAFDRKAEDEILKDLEPDYVSGLTVLGGEPFEEENQAVLVHFLKRVKDAFPCSKDIWAYTGYVYKDLLPGGRKHTVYTDEMLSYIDILVDGPFVESQKDLMLRFRGSANQRIIDMNQTKQTGKLVLSGMN